MRYVDDIFVIQQKEHKQTFLEHINKVDPAIKIIVEGNQENGIIPFLDTLAKPEADNTLSKFRGNPHILINTCNGITTTT